MNKYCIGIIKQQPFWNKEIFLKRLVFQNGGSNREGYFAFRLKPFKIGKSKLLT